MVSCSNNQNEPNPSSNNISKPDSIITKDKKGVNKSKVEYTYNSNGKEILEVNYQWDTTTNSWKNRYKSENTYDSNGNNTLNMGYNWDVTNTWKNSGKYEFTYNSTGKVTLHMGYQWDATTN